MANVSTRVLKDQLSSYLHRAESGERVIVLRDGHPVAALVAISSLPVVDEETALTRLAAQEVLLLPKESPTSSLRGPLVRAQPGELASEMVLQDRR